MNIKHLEFIYNRMIEKHGERPNSDYMKNLKDIIDELKEEEEKEKQIENGKNCYTCGSYTCIGKWGSYGQLVSNKCDDYEEEV